MFEFIKKLCEERCGTYFKKSSDSCVSHINFKERLSFMIKPSTLLEVKVAREIQKFCTIEQNHFWRIYYRICEFKISSSCKKSYKPDLCQSYISKKVVEHLKKFDVKQESKVFVSVKGNLKKIDKVYQENSLELEDILKKSLDSDTKDNTDEIIKYYTKKIINEYSTKDFDFDIASALLENIMIESKSDKIERELRRYKVYQSVIILEEFISQSFDDNREEGSVFFLPILMELLNREKFVNYIKKPIESRLIDFTRSRPYYSEKVYDIEENQYLQTSNMREHSSIEHSDIDNMLKQLDNDSRIIYKLKFGIQLDNREFLRLTHKMNYLGKYFIDIFTPDEKLYIKFSIHYGIDDDSEHFSMIDIAQTKASIYQKILDYRGKEQSHSYIETHEEVFIKLIYIESLSAKEIGTIFDLTAKQVGKKVENIKNRLKKMEYQL
jgi:hypothetical protein